jgi:hypothetical protein
MSDLYFMHPQADHPMFLRTKQSIEGGYITYELRVARALLEDIPVNWTKFEGLFCVDGLVLHRADTLRGIDSVILEPECLAMHLMRLAYIAAHHQEGPYGEPEEFSQDTD